MCYVALEPVLPLYLEYEKELWLTNIVIFATALSTAYKCTLDRPEAPRTIKSRAKAFNSI